MGDIIPFDSKELPAYLNNVDVQGEDLTSGVSAGFPFLSIKGKVFTVVRDDERTIVTNPDDPDSPASSIQVVLIKASRNISKVYYDHEYEEGSQEKPTCTSVDGEKPDADCQDPQSKTCAACPHNVWGSGRNGKGKACADVRRVAVAPSGQLNDPMLLRVPPASLRPLAEYGSMLTKRGLPYNAVVTKLRFDPAESSPKLMLSPVGVLSQGDYQQVLEVAESDVVASIIGGTVAPAAEAPAVEERSEEQKPAKKRTAKKKAPPVAEEAPTTEPEPVKEPEPEIEDDIDDLDALLAEYDA